MLLSIAAFSPVAAQAQSLPDGINLSGEVEIEGLSSSGDKETLYYGDLDASFDLGASGLGFDLGFLGVSDGSDSESAIFAALTYGTQHGKFSVGMPRNALRDFTRMPDIGGVKYLSLATAPFTNGLVEDVILFGDADQLGARYDGDYGNLKVAVSYHDFDDFDASATDIAASYESGIYFVTGGVEFLNGSGSDANIFHVEAGAQADYYSAGIGFTTSDDVLPDATMAWASYSALPNTDLTVSLMDVDGTTIYGLSGEWRFLNYSRVQLGVADSTDGDAIWDASIGLRF
ncbi:hypothetical protein OEW28_15415 [Defluviimonas sp. WL0002]|uniref:Porin n=1 Tax=Albidovulum marisflavi TaxID=2984159 RepID=A0ABT2ZFZ7_9RHOB|nr:hypothetical protein [Defluviimonas sp. WL0002]MCV2870019.1 hypothetical protein [Defluviimonas sp. WL0002]